MNEPASGTRRDDARQRAHALSVTANIRLVARLAAVVVGISALSLLLPGTSDVPPEPIRTTAIVLGLLLGASLFVSPWERWAVDARATRGLLVVMTAGAVVVSVVVASADGATSRFVWVYGLVLLFAGMLLPRNALLAFFAVTVTSYVAAAVAATGPLPLDELLFRVGMLALIATTSRLVARQLRRATRTALEQADVLSTVAEAGRAVQQLEPERVLEELAGHAQALDYDLVGIYVRTEDGTLRFAATRGIDEHLRRQRFRREGGVVGQVMATGRTWIEEDYASSPVADERFRERGLRTAIGTPIYSRGELAGVLVGGTLAPRTYASHDVGALELLAGIAGRALGTATAFADQQLALDQLRALDQAKSDFVSTVSHELRTPLTVIQGSADTLARRWDQLSPELARQLLERLRANARSLDDVLGSLLDLARLEGGQLETRFDHFDLAAVVGRVHDRLTPLLAAHDVRVMLDRALHVLGDERLIERVVENLVSNAARHTPPGTGIEIDALATPSRITLRVRDQGPGMEPSDLDRLGERFFRGGDPLRRPSRGVGLGLALSIEILRLHGTELEVTSSPGAGTDFAFSLRRAAHEGDPGERT